MYNIKEGYECTSVSVVMFTTQLREIQKTIFQLVQLLKICQMTGFVQFVVLIKVLSAKYDNERLKMPDVCFLTYPDFNIWEVFL